MSIFTFRPTEGFDPLAELRVQYPADSGSRLIRPITNIAAIGARYSETYLSVEPNDRFYLQRALARCKELQVPISAKWELTPLNILYGDDQDILNPNLRFSVDMLIVCFVFDPRGMGNKRKFVGFHDGMSISPYHLDKHAWREAAKRSGARIIATFNNGHEVNSRHFKGRDYIPAGIFDVGPCKMEVLLRQDVAKMFPEVICAYEENKRPLWSRALGSLNKIMHFHPFSDRR